MTRGQEDKIIAQAQDILERRMAAEKNIKINLQNVMYYGAYLLGAQMTVEKLIPYVMQNYRGDDKVYIKAELHLITSSKRNMQLWLDGTKMRYRNHKRDKKGNDHLLTPEYWFPDGGMLSGISDERLREFEIRKFLRKFWGLDNPDIEWYKLERV